MYKEKIAKFTLLLYSLLFFLVIDIESRDNQTPAKTKTSKDYLNYLHEFFFHVHSSCCNDTRPLFLCPMCLCDVTGHVTDGVQLCPCA